MICILSVTAASNCRTIELLKCMFSSRQVAEQERGLPAQRPAELRHNRGPSLPDIFGQLTGGGTAVARVSASGSSVGAAAPRSEASLSPVPLVDWSSAVDLPPGVVFQSCALSSLASHNWTDPFIPTFTIPCPTVWVHGLHPSATGCNCTHCKLRNGLLPWHILRHFCSPDDALHTQQQHSLNTVFPCVPPAVLKSIDQYPVPPAILV
jgi:hypothetical protein